MIVWRQRLQRGGSKAKGPEPRLIRRMRSCCYHSPRLAHVHPLSKRGPHGATPCVVSTKKATRAEAHSLFQGGVTTVSTPHTHTHTHTPHTHTHTHTQSSPNTHSVPVTPPRLPLALPPSSSSHFHAETHYMHMHMCMCMHMHMCPLQREDV